MNFKDVANTFKDIESQSSRIVMTETLAHLFKSTTPSEAKILAYLSLGVLNPPYVGTQFNIAQKSMVKVVSRLLNDSEENIETLLKKEGDIGSILELYEWKIKEQISLKEVYKRLQEIECISGTGSQEKKIVKTYELLQDLTPLEGKFVLRIMMGTLRLGFSDMTLIDAFSWMEVGNKTLRVSLEHAYNICADIGLIVETLKTDGIEAIKEMEIHIGVPIRPEAAERLPDAQAIIDKIGPCVAQPKIDGFRLQIHVDKTGKEPLIRFFSRNLIDMSYMFPEFVEVCKKLSVKNIILDGEAIVYDPNTKLFMSFQETVKRRRKHGIEEMVSEFPLQLHVFDLLFLDGKSFLPIEHIARRKRLKELFSSDEYQTIRLIEEKNISTGKELEEYFIHEIASGLEGIIAKRPHAHYVPGKRNFNWIKLKYQASEKLEDTLDVVILGYYAGHGKRAKFGIGAFLVGVYDRKRDSFETVAKIGTGLSDEQWVELKKKCDALKVSSQPKQVICDKSLFPDVWVNPEIVCEVLADEITFSPVHTAGKLKETLGFALRFPRFVQYRPDKSSYQTTTVAELKTLQER